MAKTKAKSRVSAKAAPTPTTAVERQTEAPNRKLGRSTAGKRGAGLPPGSGEPPPQRAVKVLSFPGRGADTGGRSRMAAGLQQAVGNARMGRMLEQGQPAGPGSAGQESGKGPAGAPPPGSGGAVPGGAAGAPADAKPPAKKLGLVGRMVARVKAALTGKKGEGKEGEGKKGEKEKAKKAKDEKKGKKGEGKGEKKAKAEKKGEKEKPEGEGEAPPGEAPAAEAGAGAAGPPPEAAPAAPEPVPAAAGSAGVVESFTRSSVSQIAAGIGSFGQRTAEGINEDRQTTEKEAPPLATGSDGGADAQVMPPPPRQPEAKPFVGEEPAPPAVSTPKSGVRASSGGGGGKYGNEVKKLNSVSTAAGPRQRFKPAGEANPQKATQAEQQSLGETQAQHGALAQQISTNPGEQRVQPRTFSEERLLIVPANAEAPPETAQTPEMAEYLQLPFESGVREQVDVALSPTLEKSLAGPRAQIAEGARKRDADVESRLAESQQAAVAMGQEADREQAHTVQEARAGVVAEKEKGLAEGRQKLDEVNTEISQKRREKVGEINRRIESDEKKADDELEKAEKKSEDEKAKAKKKAEEKKRKAEREEDDLPWYKKIAKFFTRIFDALVNVVKGIMNAVKSAVKGIISAAQKMAKGLIDACTKFVTAAIKVFGDIAKSLVTNLVGAVFPELAAQINAVIDAAVEVATEVVKQIGDKLKEGVDKVADTLNKAVDFVHNYYTSLVTGALRMLQALLTGDFIGIFIEAFRAAANSVGLPGDAILETLKRAGKQLIHVIKNPATFIGNMLKAMKKGLDQFMANFGQHIQTALMDWLFGPIGITLPKSFNLAGIFDIVRQVLGLTFEYVRERAAGIVGEENMERVEKVVGYVKRLFTEGPGALWKEFKAYLGDLKQTVMDEVKSWLITKIVQAAIIKLTSMLVPGGGFVQAIISIWETLKFLKEKINEILEVVNSVLDSIEKIANGAIGAAANYIEQTMVKTMPLVMDFLARLLKIGNVPEKVQNIVEKLRTPVDKAVDMVVGGIAGKVRGAATKMKKKAGMRVEEEEGAEGASGAEQGEAQGGGSSRGVLGAARAKAGAARAKMSQMGEKAKAKAGRVKAGAKGAAGRVKAWWKKRKKFRTKSGEQHELFFRGEGKRATPMVASNNPVPVLDKLKEWKGIYDGDREKYKSAGPLLVRGSKLAEKIDNEGVSVGFVRILKELFEILEGSEFADVDADALAQSTYAGPSSSGVAPRATENLLGATPGLLPQIPLVPLPPVPRRPPAPRSEGPVPPPAQPPGLFPQIPRVPSPPTPRRPPAPRSEGPVPPPAQPPGLLPQIPRVPSQPVPPPTQPPGLLPLKLKLLPVRPQRPWSATSSPPPRRHTPRSATEKPLVATQPTGSSPREPPGSVPPRRRPADAKSFDVTRRDALEQIGPIRKEMKNVVTPSAGSEATGMSPGGVVPGSFLAMAWEARGIKQNKRVIKHLDNLLSRIDPDHTDTKKTRTAINFLKERIELINEDVGSLPDLAADHSTMATEGGMFGAGASSLFGGIPGTGPTPMGIGANLLRTAGTLLAERQAEKRGEYSNPQVSRSRIERGHWEGKPEGREDIKTKQLAEHDVFKELSSEDTTGELLNEALKASQQTERKRTRSGPLRKLQPAEVAKYTAHITGVTKNSLSPVQLYGLPGYEAATAEVNQQSGLKRRTRVLLRNENRRKNLGR